MKKITKVLLIIATFLILIGGGLFTLGLYNNGLVFFHPNQVTATYKISTDFNSINIDVRTSNVKVLPSTDNTNQVICYETDKITHKVEVIDNSLNITFVDNSKFYDHIMIYSNINIEVYLSKTMLDTLSIEATTGDINITKSFAFNNVDIDVTTGDITFEGVVNNTLNINTTTGDIEVSNTNANNLSLKTTTGDIKINDVNAKENIETETTSGDFIFNNVACKTFLSNGTTGDVKLKNVIVNDKMYIERNTGFVYLDRCDANDIEIKTTTGDIKGSLLSEKNFKANTSTGEVKVPSSSSNSICKLNTTTGDIIITIIKD